MRCIEAPHRPVDEPDLTPFQPPWTEKPVQSMPRPELQPLLCRDKKDPRGAGPELSRESKPSPEFLLHPSPSNPAKSPLSTHTRGDGWIALAL